MSDTIANAISFLFEIDKLKLVTRKSYIQSGVRLENSAEHSWHLAMACWALANKLERKLNMEKLLKLALIHDLGEIDGGDTFLYASNRDQAHIEERQCLQRLSLLAAGQIDDLEALWEEQEQGLSAEARLLKVVDRLLPFMLNVKSKGISWIENGICRTQVETAHRFIRELEPEIHQWISDRIDHAVVKGWLLDK